MKNPIDQFKQVLLASPLKSNDSSLKFIGEYSVKKAQIESYETLLSIYDFFPKRDEVEILVFSDSEDKIQVIEDRRNEYEELLNTVDDELKIQIKISKSNKGVVSIYDFQSFFQNFERKTFIEKINQFISMIGNSDFVYFDCFDSDDVSFLKTNRVIFDNYDKNYINKIPFEEAAMRSINYTPVIMEKEWKKQILPDWFHIISSKDNPFSTIFKELTSLLSLFFISKTAELTDNDGIKFFFSTEDINPTSFSKETLLELDFFKIYDWIFENDAYSDKLILAQSILEKNKIFTRQSISKLLELTKQSWNIYLMKNAEKYLQARNEIAENINNTFEKLSKAYTYLIDKFRSNIIAIFTFFLTLIVSNSFSQANLDKIFSYNGQAGQHRRRQPVLLRIPQGEGSRVEALRE